MQILDFSHLKKVNMSWPSHAKRSLKISLYMCVGCILSFIHAIFPFLFYRSGTDIINYIKENLLNEKTIS